MTWVGLRFDWRSGPAGAAHDEMAATALDICEWADTRFDEVVVSISEHHGSADGYLPSPFVFAAAIAGRTKRARVVVAATLLPLHDILRLAEDIAVADLVSGGRIDTVFAAGYRYEEFEMFGVDITQRGRLMEEGITTLRKAWTGEPFDHRGVTVRVTPRPGRDRYPILMAGSSVAAANRAARLGDGFVPSNGRVMAAYLDELERLGKPAPPERGRGPAPTVVLVHENPDRGWSHVAEHCLHDMNSYATWVATGRGGDGPHFEVASTDELRATGRYAVVTPGECVDLVRQHGGLQLHPLVGGIPRDIALEVARADRSRRAPVAHERLTNRGRRRHVRHAQWCDRQSWRLDNLALVAVGEFERGIAVAHRLRLAVW